MAAEGARGGEFAQAVANHIFGDVDRHMSSSVMDGDRMTNHLREDHTGAAPGANHFLFAFLIHRFDSL